MELEYDCGRSGGEFESESGGDELDEDAEVVEDGEVEAGLDALRSLWSLIRIALRISVRLAKTASWSDACTRA